MNDPLLDAIEAEFGKTQGHPAWTDRELASVAAYAVRSYFAALPPSEEEIAAAAKVLHEYDCGCELELHGTDYPALARDALVASRAVMVPPPEDAQ